MCAFPLSVFYYVSEYKYGSEWMKEVCSCCCYCFYCGSGEIFDLDFLFASGVLTPHMLIFFTKWLRKITYFLLQLKKQHNKHFVNKLHPQIRGRLKGFQYTQSIQSTLPHMWCDIIRNELIRLKCIFLQTCN